MANVDNILTCWSTFFPISYRSDTQCVEIIYEQEIPILDQNPYRSIFSQTIDELFICTRIIIMKIDESYFGIKNTP